MKSVYTAICLLAIVLALIASGCSTPAPTQGSQPTGPLSITAPSGNVTYAVGDSLVIQWDADTDSVNDVLIYLVLDNGASELLITTEYSIDYSMPTWGRFAWLIPESANGQSLAGSSIQVKITDYEYSGTDDIHDYSEGYVKIIK